jgi:hypothetical protein
MHERSVYEGTAKKQYISSGNDSFHCGYAERNGMDIPPYREIFRTEREACSEFVP